MTGVLGVTTMYVNTCSKLDLQNMSLFSCRFDPVVCFDKLNHVGKSLHKASWAVVEALSKVVASGCVL